MPSTRFNQIVKDLQVATVRSPPVPNWERGNVAAESFAVNRQQMELTNSGDEGQTTVIGTAAHTLYPLGIY
jgi:hypothetical protein